MSNRWATGSVAGVSLQDAGGRPLRTDVLDAEPFRGTLSGNAQQSLDLTTHVQILSRGTKGIHFGIHVAQIPVSKVALIVAAIESAIGAGNPFNVTLADDAGADSINKSCVPDYQALEGKLYRRGAIAAGYMKDLVMRFISVT